MFARCSKSNWSWATINLDEIASVDMGVSKESNGNVHVVLKSGTEHELGFADQLECKIHHSAFVMLAAMGLERTIEFLTVENKIYSPEVMQATGFLLDISQVVSNPDLLRTFVDFGKNGRDAPEVMNFPKSNVQKKAPKKTPKRRK